ncbi:hypothetical protein BGZ74_000128, partial [Mortierella antarctica]
MVSLKIVAALTAILSLSTRNLIDAAPARIDKRALNSGAPLASDVGGASIIMDNDADSATSKISFLLLSKPRGYYDGMNACSSMTSAGYIYIPGTAAANSLVKLLKNNAPAQNEVSAYNQFWVYNGVPGVLSNCLAVNKNTGNTDWIPCSTQLPTVCGNNVMRRVLLFDDTSRQVKVNTPVGTIQG